MREINTHKHDGLFAGTPPLEALKCVLSMAANGNNGRVIVVNDVSRAFVHAKVRRKVCAQLANEGMLPGEKRMCGRLNFNMYGATGAAQNCANEYAKMLIDIGSTQGTASPCVLYRQERKIRTFVHGGDYVSSAIPKQLEWLKQELERTYKIKTQWLGAGGKLSEGNTSSITLSDGTMQGASCSRPILDTLKSSSTNWD